MIRNLARKIAVEKLLPARAELDEKEEFPWEIVKISAEAGLMGVSMPEEYEGFGGGILEYCLVAEELSRVCLGIATSVVASGLGAMPILLFGNPEQKKKYLPDIAKGRKLAAFGLTEADAGSDETMDRRSVEGEKSLSPDNRHKPEKGQGPEDNKALSSGGKRDDSFRRDQTELIEEIIHFPKADHDDGPDALEMAVDLARQGMTREQADEIVNKLLAKYEADIPDAPVGEPFQALYDVRKAVPKPAYLDRYLRIRKDRIGEFVAAQH
jgi:hypothetical protein